MFLPLQTSPLTHGRTISLLHSQEGLGNGASLAQPQLRQWHNHPPHRQPLGAAPCPMQSCWDGSCGMQPCLWGWGSCLHGVQGSAASVPAEQGSFGPEQGCNGPSSGASSAVP